MSASECTQDRPKRCAREGSSSRDECVEERDLSYSLCAAEEDRGYRDCCGWIPCKWVCDAWVWVKNIVCTAWSWVENIVCVAVRTLIQVFCLLWVYLTLPVCLLVPGVTRFLDRVLGWFIGAVVTIFSGVVSIFVGVINAITHPAETIGTIIDLFRGCPDVRSDRAGRPFLIAHHGYTKAMAENTVQGGDIALRTGADALEIDLCVTGDNQVVLWHDWDPDHPVSLARQTGRPAGAAYYPDVPDVSSEWRRPVGELTLAELRQHYTYRSHEDAADKILHDTEFGPERDLAIPTLAEFMDAAEHWKGLRLLCLDVKLPGSAAHLAGVLTDEIRRVLPRDSTPDVIVMVPSFKMLRAMKARSQEMNHGLVFTWDVEFPGGVILNPLAFSAIDHAVVADFHNAAASVGRPISLLAWRLYKRTIAYDIERWSEVNGDTATQNAGQRIEQLIAWTVNDREELECLVRMNVSGIITDEVKILRELLRG